MSYITNGVNTTQAIPHIIGPQQPDIMLVLLITVGLLSFVKLASMAYLMYDSERSKRDGRKYRELRASVLNNKQIWKRSYSSFRKMFNGKQLEFDFVKEIDEQHIDKYMTDKFTEKDFEKTLKKFNINL